MERKLTEKQKRFCEEYLLDLNATQAAIRAGYSASRASEIGYQLLQKTTVQNYIQKKQAERSERTGITQDRVLRELAAIAFADATDYVQVVEKPLVDSDGEKILDNSGKEIMLPDIQITETDKLKPEQKKAIAGIKHGRGGIELKLNDKTKALELLGRHLGMWNDKQEVKLSPVNIEDFLK